MLWLARTQLQAGELLGRHSERDRGQALSSLCALKTLTDLMQRCRDGEGRVAAWAEQGSDRIGLQPQGTGTLWHHPGLSFMEGASALRENHRRSWPLTEV